MEKLEIRIFPMDEKELYNYMKINNITTIKEIQDNFFMRDLKLNKKGKFLIKKSQLKTSIGSLILFQYNKQLIASAIYNGTFEIDKNSEEYKNDYKEYYLLSPESIEIFSPITEKEFQDIKEIKFGKIKHKISYDKYEKIKNLIILKNNQLLKQNKDTNIPLNSSKLIEKIIFNKFRCA